MSNILACYQLLELNVIAAQDLAPVGRSMRTYAVAWTDPDRKLSTRVDSLGGTNPTWNDKFVFRVDEEFLYDENSTITIDIYALHWFRDIHVGTANVLAEDIIPPSQSSPNGDYKPTGMRFVGLQVLRPSGRPKGILNVGVAVIDSSTRSMPLYTHNNTPIVGYHHDDLHNQPRHQPNPELRRTKSDTSSMVGSEAALHKNRVKAKRGRASSQVTPSEVSRNSNKETSSTLSGSSVKAKRTPKRGKFGRTKKKYANEQLNETAIVSYDYEVKASPKPQFRNSPATARAYNNGNVRATPLHDGVRATPLHGGVRATPLHGGVRATPFHDGVRATPLHGGVRATPLHGGVRATPFHDGVRATPIHGGVRATPLHGGVRATPFHDGVRATPIHDGVRATPLHGGVRATPLHAFAVNNAAVNATLEYGTPYRSNMGHRRLIITDSELGPSASEVAAAMARQPVMEEGENSTVTGWSLDDSVEDLQPKIERWRTDLAPVYDNGDKSTLPALSSKKKGKHSRRRTDGDGGNGLFSCFSVICGVECSIVCGGDKKKNRLRRSQSVDNTSFL